MIQLPESSLRRYDVTFQPYFLPGKYLEKHTKYGMPCASEHSGTGRKTIFFSKFPFVFQGNNVII